MKCIVCKKEARFTTRYKNHKPTFLICSLCGKENPLQKAVEKPFEKKITGTSEVKKNV